MCDKCFYVDNGVKIYFECCCEIDRLQVIEDENRVIRDGYKCVNGRWIKKSKKKIQNK
jgi:hypothetical protein